jgi:hypothetical protein
MTKALFVLLGLGWLVFALSGYVVGYVVDYVNGSSATYFFLMLDNGTLIPLVEPLPAHLVGTGERVEAEIVYTEATPAEQLSTHHTNQHNPPATRRGDVAGLHIC